MKKTASTFTSTSTSTSIESINRKIRSERLQELGEPEVTLGGRLARVLRVFGVIRPLLLFAMSFPLLPPATRAGVTVFVESLKALSVLASPGDGEDAADFKAGRDL